MQPSIFLRLVAVRRARRPAYAKVSFGRSIAADGQSLQLQGSGFLMDLEEREGNSFL